MKLLIAGIILLIIGVAGICGVKVIDRFCEEGKMRYNSIRYIGYTYACSLTALLGTISGVSCLVAGIFDAALR